MSGKLNWLDRTMLAVTFAEAGCPELTGGSGPTGKVDGKSGNLDGRGGVSAAGTATRREPLPARC